MEEMDELTELELRQNRERMLSDMKDGLRSVDEIVKNHKPSFQFEVNGRNMIFELVSDPIDGENSVNSLFNDIVNRRVTSEVNKYKNHLVKTYAKYMGEVYKYRDLLVNKEARLNELANENFIMPDVTYEHASRGLSIVKGSNPGEVCWLVTGVYSPKKIINGYNEHYINEKYVKKMVTPVVFYIRTNSVKNILDISVRKPIGLVKFEHYHGRGRDCWGNWAYPKTFEFPEDIIVIARTAEKVLEYINVGSIMNGAPVGLPRLATLNRNTVTERPEDPGVNANAQRAGVDENLNEVRGDGRGWEV